MKKLAFFSIFLIVSAVGIFDASAAKNCKQINCSLDSRWVKIEDSEKFKAPGSSQCYYCDVDAAGDSDCSYKTIVAIRDNVNTNEYTDIRQCTPNYGTSVDTWNDDRPSTFCDNSPLKVDGLSYDNNSSWPTNSRMYFSPKGIATTPVVSGDSTVFLSGTIFCRMLVCNDGFTASADKKTCIEQGKAACEADATMEWVKGACVCKDIAKEIVNGKCESVFTEPCKKAGGIWNSDKATCDCGKDKEWYPNSLECALTSEAKQKLAARKAECKAASATGAFWSPTLNRCDCSDKSKLWSDSQKQCVEKSADCDAATISWLHEMQAKYTDADITKSIVSILDFCTKNSSNRSQTELENNIANLKLLIQKYEDAKTQKSQAITTSTTTIKTLSTNITSMESGFDASVWKDAKGDFNKSRLISDSVAGVVLGTAGGLITSSVIKKNQTANGFEDISCTVGGQIVAGWNDEFTVGMK